ncbi:MAG: 4Fe-4S binding protein [Coriobacteriales bacterium]|jgi:ferredoxin|nr:4Fe-4S binding protein [Coriobacteriales bacterium]
METTMPDIINLIEALDNLSSIDIDVEPDRCVKVRNINAKCSRCAKSCTSEAIKVSDNKLYVEKSLCIGCGTCATNCPTSALSAKNPTNAEILELSIAIANTHDSSLVFTCSKFIQDNAHSFDTNRVVKVACLGRLNEAVLITLLASGINSIAIVHANCDSCQNTNGKTTMLAVLDNTEKLLCAWNQNLSISLLTEMPENLRLSKQIAKKNIDSSGLSRREFFAQFKTGAKTIASELTASIMTTANTTDAQQPPQKVMKDGTLPHFMPQEREVLLNSLSLLGNPTAEQITTRLWGQIEIDIETCTTCQMCATFCPTGAITKFKETDDVTKNEIIGIEHYPAHCLQCRVCEDICLTNALKVNSAINLKHLINGTAERFVMRPQTRKINKPDSIYRTMYELLGGGQIYER